MSSLKITNPPPKFVRARYLREVKKGRGFITGANGSNVQLQVDNTWNALCFNGAKCVAKVKSVATRQAHTSYALFKCEWDVTIEENGIVKVDLDRLAVVWPNKCKEDQKRDMGEFYLEFVLRFAKEYSIPDLICHTEEMFDETWKETCRPKIKDVIPQCAVGGEIVCIQCTNDVAKISEVEAIFSGMIGDSEVHFPAIGEVDRNLVKIVMPCQYDDSIKDVTKLQLKLRVNKNDNIVSNAFTFGYLPKTFCRPKITNFNEEVPNLGKNHKTRTFQTRGLIELPSMNTECGVVTGLIRPKDTSNPSNLSYDRSESSKAFHETKNACLDEKERNISSAHIDIVCAAIKRTRLDGQIQETSDDPTISATNVVIPNQMRSFNQEFPLPSILAKVEPQPHKPELNGQDFQNHTNDVQSPKTPPNCQVNAYTGLSGIQQKCDTDEIFSTPSTGKDLEELQSLERPPNDQVNSYTGPSGIQHKYNTKQIISNPSTGNDFEKLQTFISHNPNSRSTGNPLDVSPGHNFNDNTCHLRTTNKVAPEEISRSDALTLSQMNVGVTRNNYDLTANCNLDMPTSSCFPCSPGMEEELPPGNLSASVANGAARNEQKCIASVSSASEQFGHVLTSLSSFSLSNNLDTGPGPMDILIHGGISKESTPPKLATNKNFNDLANCHTPLTMKNFPTQEIIPVQVTDENSPSQFCYTDSTYKNNRLDVPVLNHSDSPPFHSSTSKPQSFSDDNDFSKMDISLECIISAHQNVMSNGTESWKDLNEHVIGNRDILKENEAKGTDKNMMKRRIVSNYPARGNHNPSHDLHGQPKTKVMKFS